MTKEWDRIPNIHWATYKTREFQKDIYFVDYAKAFDCVDHSKLWKILWEMGYQTTSPASFITCLNIKKQQFEPDMEQQTGSKLGKEYIKAVYCHPAYLIYMQCISCKMLDWIKHELESRLPDKVLINSDMQMTPVLQQKEKGN